MGEEPVSKGSGPFNYTIDQWNDLVGATPSIQPKSVGYGSIFHWVEGTRGVWVLDPPTDEQWARYHDEPRPKTEEELYQRMRAIGAAFYTDYVCMQPLIAFIILLCRTIVSFWSFGA